MGKIIPKIIVEAVLLPFFITLRLNNCVIPQCVR